MLINMALENQEVRDKAEFNMALSYLNRLNSLFYAADESAIKLDIHTWFHVLTAIFREISTEMKEAEINKSNNKIVELNNLVMKQTETMQRTQKFSIDPKLYLQLHFFELELRAVMKSSGLQMKVQSDASRALFNE